VVAKKIGRPVVRGEQQVNVAIAIEVGKGKSTADAGSGEAAPDAAGCISKFSLSKIQKKMGRLSVADVAANVPDRVVDVPVGNDEITSPVAIEGAKARH